MNPCSYNPESGDLVFHQAKFPYNSSPQLWVETTDENELQKLLETKNRAKYQPRNQVVTWTLASIMLLTDHMIAVISKKN